MPLTDEQWQLVQGLLDEPGGFVSFAPWLNQPPSRRPRGRPASNPRPILDAVLLKLAAGIPWRTLPTTHPSWQTCFRAYLRWKENGTLFRVIMVLLDDLAKRGGFDFLRALTEGHVHLEMQFGRTGIFYSSAVPLTWQLLTSSLFYRHHIESVEWKLYGGAPGPLVEILGMVG